MTNKELADKTVLLLCEEDENREYDNLVLLAERILNENDCSFKARVVAMLERQKGTSFYSKDGMIPKNVYDIIAFVDSHLSRIIKQISEMED